MKYPKREINSEPFKNQLDIIERITIEIKHQSNNPIFKTNQRFTNNQNYNRYHHHHHNNNNNNNKNKKYGGSNYQYNNYGNFQPALNVETTTTSTTTRLDFNNENLQYKLVDKLFDPFKPVELDYGSMNTNIWRSNNDTTNNNGSNGNCIY